MSTVHQLLASQIGTIVERHMNGSSDEELQAALAELKAYATTMGVYVDPELLRALIPALSNLSYWQSSSQSC